MAETSSESLQKTSANILLSILAYAFCSTSMTLLNKSLMSKFDFPYTNFVVMAQCVIGAVLYQMSVTVTGGLITGSPFEWKREARRFWPLTVAHIAMLVTSFMSLRYLSIPLATIFKYLTNVAVLAGDWYFYGERVTPLILLSVVMVVAASFFAGQVDFRANLAGYIWMLLNCCSTAGNILLMRYVCRASSDDAPALDSLSLNYIKNAMSLPIIGAVMVIQGEAVEVWSSPLLTSPAFIGAILTSSVIGFGVGSAAMWCIQMTSATTYATVGSMNRITLSIMGIIVFGDMPTARQGMFIVLGLAGGMVYAYAKALQKNSGRNSRAVKSRWKTGRRAGREGGREGGRETEVRGGTRTTR